MNGEAIERWIEKVGQQLRAKRQLDDGTAPGPKRARQHYPTPEGDCQEEQEQEQERGQERQQKWRTERERTRTRQEREVVTDSRLMDNRVGPDEPDSRGRVDLDVDVDVDEVDGMDADPTPRAARLRLASNQERLRFAATSTGSPPSSAASRSTTTSSSGATKRSRRSDGTSPSKRAVLSSLSRPITFPVFHKDTVPRDAAAGIRQLYERVRRFEQCQGVLPAVDKELLEREGHIDPVVDLAHVYFDEHHYRASLGGTPSLADIDKLVNRARHFRQLGESEAAWNGYIDIPLFLLAEAASVHQGRISSTNITTARIGPTSLIPTTRANVRIEGKMVDFALVLEESDATKAAASRLPPNARQGVFSFNHTLHSPLLHRPVAVSIETKRHGENFQDALAQLGIWASAHFARLTELLTAAGRADVRPPMLPLLVAQGSDWKFLLAEKTLAGEVNIWNKLDVGDIATHRGVYTTVSVLLLLIDWAEKYYRPWFEENICNASG